ncbi:MAG: flagellar biosynthetic protein FliO [Thiobacillaceae bacterium]|jgi:flagellar protein FliO/FliZ
MNHRSRIAGWSLLLMPALAVGAGAPAATMASSTGSVFQVVLGLLVVVMLILGLSWLSKRMGITQNLGSSPVKVVGSVSLGGRERAVLIEVNDTWIVAGVATGQVNALATLPRGEMPSAGQLPSAGFAARFKSMVEKSGHGK